MLAYSSIAHAGYLLVGVAAVGHGVVAARPALAWAVTSSLLSLAGVPPTGGLFAKLW